MRLSGQLKFGAGCCLDKVEVAAIVADLLSPLFLPLLAPESGFYFVLCPFTLFCMACPRRRYGSGLSLASHSAGSEASVKSWPFGPESLVGVRVAYPSSACWGVSPSSLASFSLMRLELVLVGGFAP